MIADGYKDTIVGVIPIEWETIQLKDVVYKDRKITYGIVQPGKNIAPDGIPLIRGKDYSSGKVITDDLYYVSEEIDKPYKRSKVIENDLLMTIVGYIGQMAIVPKSLIGANITQTTARISVNKDLYSYQYIYQYFLSQSGYKRLKKFEKGSAQPGLNLADVEKVIIPLPPLKEQEKIADILSTADAKIDAIQIQINKAEILKIGLLQKLLSEGIGHSEFKNSEIGKIPESWDIIPFLELADKNVSHSFTGGPFGSDLKSEHYTNEGVRVIQLQNIGDGSFLNNDFVYTSEEKAEALKTCQIYPNDILLAKMAEPVARACILPNIESKYLMGSDGIRLHIDKSKYDTHFIFQSINHNRFRDIAVARSTGTTRLRIGLTALKKIPIAIPPLEEQKQIANILSTADEKLEVLRAKKKKYETLKKGLSQKLLSGEVRV